MNQINNNRSNLMSVSYSLPPELSLGSRAYSIYLHNMTFYWLIIYYLVLHNICTFLCSFFTSPLPLSFSLKNISSFPLMSTHICQTEGIHSKKEYSFLPNRALTNHEFKKTMALPRLLSIRRHFPVRRS